MAYLTHNRSPQLSQEPQTVDSPAAPVERQVSQDNTLQIALEHARRLSEMYGTDNIQVALAWETVEELLSAKAHQRETVETSFERYCRLNPDAPECRVYDL